MNRKLLFVLLLSTALVACTAAPGAKTSGINAPAAWSQSGVTNPAGKIDQQWWRAFGDNTLNALIADALANNKTLAITKARVEESRAQRTAARASLLPNISGTASAKRYDGGINSARKTYGVAEADVDASWELDLFGGNQLRMSAANAILQSEEANANAVRVSLLSEVARNYFDMRNAARQMDITQRNLETEQKTYSLIQAQQRGGLASDFDIQRSGAEVSRTQSQLPLLKAAYAAAQNRLNVLMGAAPGAKNAVLATQEKMQPLSPQIVVAAPANILANRPDVRAAERQFAAAISGAKAATRDYFPKISLLSYYGFQSSSLYDAHPWSLGVNLVQPILDFGRVSSQVDAADAREKQALLSYQQTVLEALEDMENALTNYLQETDRNGSLQNAYNQSRRAAELAELQYKNGETGLLDVLVAQRNALDAEAALAASDAGLRKNLINVYAAAGGGWAADDSSNPGPAVVQTQTPDAKAEAKPDAKGVDAPPTDSVPPTQTVVTPGAAPNAVPSNAPRVSKDRNIMVIE